ncbi:MAG: hypothetical protein WC705_00385 [Candidatus Paceibacterota bacterium]|jgi:hypothetical protein
MNYKYILVAMFAVLVFGGVLVNDVEATVGGPTFIYGFKYNPVDESVYYIRVDQGGRGCPPELMKMSLATGQSQMVYSCDEGEKLNDVSAVNLIISNITSGFKDLTPINLIKNRISIDVNLVDYKKYDPNTDEILLANFKASVYQDGKEVTNFPVTGCNLEQPFTFAGYAIPGFDKKIVLLLSTKGDCWESGYTYETLYVVGGVDNLDKSSISGGYYKGDWALAPNEGTLVVFEPDKLNSNIENNNTNTPNQNTDSDSNNMYYYLIGLFVAIVLLLVGIMLGRLSVKKSNI